MANNRLMGVLGLGVLTCALSLVACGGSDSSGDESGTGGSGTGGSGTGGSATGTGGAGTGGSATGTGGSATGSGGSSSGDVTYACLLPGEGDHSTCLQYTGAATYIDAIRDAGTCDAQDGTELDECSPEGAAICVKNPEGLPTQNATYFYGLTADEIESNKTICEASTGTFTPPSP